ncbi:MAG: hypothetical protein HYY37_05915 [Candidatus Aenigmarchaeota archaeon]|nr:hypothetical protein [Candidatus Aenigmarchaeota archaeon]
MVALPLVMVTFVPGCTSPAAPPEVVPPVVAAAVVVVVVLTVTLVVPDDVPPGVPETASENAHVPADDGAVTVQLWEEDEEPAMVPIDRVALAMLQLPEVLDSVAATAVVPPAASVPPFWMVAETVNDALVATVVEDGVMETTESSAGDVTDTCVQSAVHVPPMLTHTSCEPAVFGVSVKDTDFDSPALMLEMTCDVVSPVNQLPSSVAATLDWVCDCWLVTLTSSVPDVPLVIVLVVSEQVYCDDEQALLHAAKVTGTLSANNVSAITMPNSLWFMEGPLYRLKAVRRRQGAHER